MGKGKNYKIRLVYEGTVSNADDKRSAIELMAYSLWQELNVSENGDMPDVFTKIEAEEIHGEN